MMADSEIRARLSGNNFHYQVLPAVNDDPDTGYGVTALSPEQSTSLSTLRATTKLWPGDSAFEEDTSGGKIDGDQEDGLFYEL